MPRLGSWRSRLGQNQFDQSPALPPNTYLMPDLADINHRFALPDHLHFERGPGGLLFAAVRTELASARLCLQGAHLTDWQPRGHKPVIWLSPKAIYAPGQALRGGVPVCWPWFGAQAGGPAHGFARTLTWDVSSSALNADGSVRLQLGLVDNAQTRGIWNHRFTLCLECTIGATLTLKLTTVNCSDTTMTLTQALHSYFAVGNIEAVVVHGLENCAYQDKLRGFAWDTQRGPIRFAQETDRIYVDRSAQCVIEDPSWDRRIHIAKTGSASTVVWNPWRERAATLTDMPAESYRDMLCVETCNAGDDQLQIAPGAQHALSAHISVETISS